MLDRILDGINFFFDNDFVRLFTVVLTGIWAGYVLQPVPKWLNNLFDTSHVFKFVVLVFIGLGATSPITVNSLINIILVSTAVSILFIFMRRYDAGNVIPTIHDVNGKANANAKANNKAKANTNANAKANAKANNKANAKANNKANAKANDNNNNKAEPKPANSQTGGSCYQCNASLPYETGF